MNPAPHTSTHRESPAGDTGTGFEVSPAMLEQLAVTLTVDSAETREQIKPPAAPNRKTLGDADAAAAVSSYLDQYRRLAPRLIADQAAIGTHLSEIARNYRHANQEIVEAFGRIERPQTGLPTPAPTTSPVAAASATPPLRRPLTLGAPFPSIPPVPIPDDRPVPHPTHPMPLLTPDLLPQVLGPPEVQELAPRTLEDVVVDPRVRGQER